MDLNEANIQIKSLLDSGLTTRDLLRLAAHHRRIDLERDLCARTRNRIVGGFFKEVVHPGEAHASTLCPKILGTYEKEIVEDLKYLCQGKDCFVDIGCAEGYYTTGVGAATPIPLIIGVDISETAIGKAKESAKLNNIDNKCRFSTDLSSAVCMMKGKALVMIDVDSSEVPVIQQLFNLLPVTQRHDLELIIETDFNADSTCNEAEIIEELEKHQFRVIKRIHQNVANRFSLASEKLTKSFLDRVIYGLEGRPSDQKWLIARHS